MSRIRIALRDLAAMALAAGPETPRHFAIG